MLSLRTLRLAIAKLKRRKHGRRRGAVFAFAMRDKPPSDQPPGWRAWPANHDSEGAIDLSKLRFKISMSLDGFVAGPSQSVEHPRGIGGGRLAFTSGLFGLRCFARSLGLTAEGSMRALRSSRSLSPASVPP